MFVETNGAKQEGERTIGPRSGTEREDDWRDTRACTVRAKEEGEEDVTGCGGSRIASGLGPRVTEAIHKTIQTSRPQGWMRSEAVSSAAPFFHDEIIAADIPVGRRIEDLYQLP